jgi:hypothetical protein
MGYEKSLLANPVRCIRRASGKGNATGSLMYSVGRTQLPSPTRSE